MQSVCAPALKMRLPDSPAAADGLNTDIMITEKKKGRLRYDREH